MNYKISYLLDEYAGQKIALSLAQQITDLSQRELVTQLSTIGGEFKRIPSAFQTFPQMNGENNFFNNVK